MNTVSLDNLELSCYFLCFYDCTELLIISDFSISHRAVSVLQEKVLWIYDEFRKKILCCADWQASHVVDHQLRNKGRGDAQNVSPSSNLSVLSFNFTWGWRNTR